MGRERRYSEREKRRILSELSRSGESMLGYSRRSGVAASTLSRWKRESGHQGSEFIELKGQVVEIEYKGVVIRVPDGAGAKEIGKIVKELSCQRLLQGRGYLYVLGRRI